MTSFCRCLLKRLAFSELRHFSWDKDTARTMAYCNRIYYSDSCPAGLGGYSDQGNVWRFKLPDNLQFHALNNLLEFLAAIITPWIDIIKGRLKPGDFSLSMTDSATAEGWMRKSNFVKPDNNPIQATTRVNAARKYGSFFYASGR